MPPMDVNLYAAARGGTELYNNNHNGASGLVGNNRGDLAVAQALPSAADLVRLGASYQAVIASANAFTYVAALPTTRAELVLYNNAGVGGPSIVIDSAWMFNVSSQAAANPITLVVQNCAAGLVAAPTDGTTTIVQTSLSGKTAGLTRVGRALFALANTAFALANHWEVVAANAATATLGLSVTADLRGKYIVPPTGAFCLAGVAGTAAGTAVIGVVYHEVQLTLG
jgi:hypothetical protein